MIICLGTTPAAQRVMVFKRFVLDQVNRAARTEDGIAGKSINVAKVLQVLGANPLALGFLGGDNGRQITEHLTARGVAHQFITVTARTRQCITILDQATGKVTELVEESRPVDPPAYDQLFAIYSQNVARSRAVILSGTMATGGPADFYFRCVQAAKAAGVIAVVDAAGAPLKEALKACPTLVKPNRPELEATLGQSLDTQEALLTAMKQIHSAGAERVVITQGSKPALAFDGHEFYRVYSPKIVALNPIGSGDAFTAALTWHFQQGAPFAEACRWGAAGGAANALTLTAGDVERAEIERLYLEAKVERISLSTS